ncbi:MAG: LytTR family DNA-binding domain-containing protein [Lachnospiraceae bacterium]|nr:LytTR family DNA-binding domain-containing protein [Lachnospiraceae bacterium]
MRIAICDDSALSQIVFIDVVREWNPMEHPESFTTGAELLRAAEKVPAFDIVFLDIYFPEESGLDIAGKLRRISPGTAIVFITNSDDHAVDAYSMNALHYLMKPITKEGVREAFRRLENLRAKPRSILPLPIGRDSITLYQNEISYIVSDKHAKEIHLTDGQILRVWMEFRELEEKLDNSFQKLNKGTIVNMEQIRVMSKDFCLLRDGTKLAFSRREREKVQNAYDQFLFLRLSEM